MLLSGTFGRSACLGFQPFLKRKTQLMPVAALVLGIVGLILSLVPCLGMYALPITVLGIIFGAIGMKKETGRGMSIAGLICGTIGSLIAIWWIYALFAIKSEVEDPNSEFNQGIQQIEEDIRNSQPAPTPE